MARYTPPFMKRLQRKFPQPDPPPEPVVESKPEPEPEPESEPEVSLEDKMAEWREAVEEEDLEEALEFDDAETTDTIEWSESQLKADLFTLAQLLELDVNEESLKRDIVEALRASDQAVEI